MNSAEILFIITLLIPLVPMAIARQWWLFSLFGIFYVCFGIVELTAIKTSGHTVSQHFWNYSQDHHSMAMVILITMALMWIGLLVHLGAKMFNKKGD